MLKEKWRRVTGAQHFFNVACWAERLEHTIIISKFVFVKFNQQVLFICQWSRRRWWRRENCVQRMYLQAVQVTCNVCASLLDFHRVIFNHENGSFCSPFHITWIFPKFQHKSNSRFKLHFKCNSLVITWIIFYTVLYFLKSSDHVYTKYCRMEK